MKQADLQGGKRRGRVLGVLLAAGLAITGACSLLVETGTDQCTTNTDCAPFGAYSVCSDGICVKPAPVDDAGADAADASDAHDGSDGGEEAGCFSGDPTTDLQFYNQCTDAGCEPFDNCGRIGLCGDAGLPALVPPTDGGL